MLHANLKDLMDASFLRARVSTAFAAGLPPVAQAVAEQELLQYMAQGYSSGLPPAVCVKEIEEAIRQTPSLPQDNPTDLAWRLIYSLIMSSKDFSRSAMLDRLKNGY